MQPKYLQMGIFRIRQEKTEKKLAKHSHIRKMDVHLQRVYIE
jgi:hypothetical protein